MEFFNSLNLTQIKGGTKLKQGDLGSVLSYSLTDENGQEIASFDNKTAYINLVLDDKIWFTTTTLVDISRVTFRIDKAIPIGLYYLEIKIDDYIFPSDRDSIILIEEGSTPYDLKELVPNYDINMTIKGILSDLSQKGIDISDLNRRIGNVNAELIASRNGKSNLKTRIDDLENKTTAQLAEKVNKDEVTNVMTPKGNIAYASLPMTGNSVGWYYYCPDGDGTHGAGNYVWNGTSWFFGGTGDEGYNLLKKDLVKHEEYFNTIAEPKDYINLLDGIETKSGYINQGTGEIIESSGYTATVDYIPCTPEDTIHFYGGIPNGLIRWAIYNNDKSFNRGYFFHLDDNGEYNFNYIATSFNYLRFSCDGFSVLANYGTEKVPKTYKVKKDALPEIAGTYDYIVAKDGSGNFTSVTEACNVAKAGESIYIKSGVYDNEVIVGTWSKKLYLVGESAKDTIIKNSLGDYNRPPIQIGGGYLKNITFYSEYTGTQERGTGATMSYAVHSESDNLANDNLTIEDCILISDYAPSFGMGMRGGCNVTLKNCYLKGTYRGALLFHDADNVSYVGEQNISLIDCILYNTTDYSCIIMQSQERNGTIVNLEMIRNRIKTHGNNNYGVNNHYGGIGGENDFLGLINFRLKETSWGNSDTTFNSN